MAKKPSGKAPSKSRKTAAATAKASAPRSRRSTAKKAAAPPTSTARSTANKAVAVSSVTQAKISTKSARSRTASATTVEKKKEIREPREQKDKTKKVAKGKDAAAVEPKATTRSRKGGGRRGSGGEGGGSSRRPVRSVAEAASTANADDQGYVFINGRRVRMITTKGKPTPRRSAAALAAAAEAAAAPPEKKNIKTPLKRKELEYFRSLLLTKRAELVGDLNSLETEALRSSGGDLSHMPIHMADIGSDTYEQDFMLGLAENERRRLREIDEALQRIEEGKYGVCEMTGNPIPKARLEAKPWAKYTIEAARLVERGGAA